MWRDAARLGRHGSNAASVHIISGRDAVEKIVLAQSLITGSQNGQPLLVIGSKEWFAA
jgi:hypothetical protein